MATDTQIEGAKMFVDWLTTLDPMTATPDNRGIHPIPITTLLETWKKIGEENAHR